MSLFKHLFNVSTGGTGSHKYYDSVSREPAEEKTLSMEGVSINNQRLKILLATKKLENAIK